MHTVPLSCASPLTPLTSLMTSSFAQCFTSSMYNLHGVSFCAPQGTAGAKQRCTKARIMQNRCIVQPRDRRGRGTKPLFLRLMHLCFYILCIFFFASLHGFVYHKVSCTTMHMLYIVYMVQVQRCKYKTKETRIH